MSIIACCSLKGGVGKTSLAVNIAHAFAYRGCMTLLIDLDPSAHASRLFCNNGVEEFFPKVSPLARAFLKKNSSKESTSLLSQNEEPFFIPVRSFLELLPSGKELRYFIAAQGTKYFAKGFPKLIEELKSHFDHIVIDTPPEFNVLTRNAIAVSDISLCPVDPSEMGIHSVEELLDCAKHIKKPIWALVRTMVNTQAERTRALSNQRLQANLLFKDKNINSEEDLINLDAEDPKNFLSLFSEWKPTDEGSNKVENIGFNRPVFLLDSFVKRSEAQNQLSFLGKTAFDNRKTSALARQYLAIARELEDILSNQEEDDSNALPTISQPISFSGKKVSSSFEKENESAVQG